MHALMTIKCVGHGCPISLHLRSPRPSWVGMMQPIHDGPNAGPSSVVFLLMIDLNRPRKYVMYSLKFTLSFICDRDRRCSVIPMVTYDKP